MMMMRLTINNDDTHEVNGERSPPFGTIIVHLFDPIRSIALVIIKMFQYSIPLLFSYSIKEGHTSLGSFDRVLLPRFGFLLT